MLDFVNINKKDQKLLTQAYVLILQKHQALSFLSSLLIEVVYCDSATIRRYKKQYYGLDEETDILTFDWREINFSQELDIINHQQISLNNNQAQILINTNLALSKAEFFKISPDSEKVILFLHGLLHLAYGDHNSKDKKDLFETVTHDIIKLMNLEYHSIWPKEKK